MHSPRVVVTASRKGTQLEAALARRGADVLLASTTGGDRPVDPAELVLATEAVIALRPAWFAASTGVGMHLWAEAADRWGRLDPFVDTLRQATCVARGAKARGGLHGLGLEPVFQSPREMEVDVAAWLAARVDPDDAIVTQVAGTPTTAFDELARSGVRVLPVAPYRRAPVADPAPAFAMFDLLLAGMQDVVTFTSPAAVHGFVELARQRGCWSELEEVLARGQPTIAVIGPVTAAACERHRLPVAIMPARSRSGNLVRSIAAWATRRTPAPVGAPSTQLLRLDPDRHRAIVGDRTVSLGEKEFRLLASLIRRPGVACPVDLLMQEAWGGAEATPAPALVRDKVSRLRAKFGDDLEIQTVRGVGYRYTGTAATS